MPRTPASKSPLPAASSRSPGVYWISGDRLLTEEFWKKLVGDAEVVRMDGKRLDVEALGREIDTLPMFVAHKWILVQDFRPPAKRAEDQGKKPANDPDRQLLDALARAGGAATVILTSESGDRRTRLAKFIEGQGGYVELQGFREYDIAAISRWVVDRLRNQGKSIPAPLASELVETVGTDLSTLASEIEKLCVSMGEETTVTDEMLSVVAGNPVALRRLLDEGIVARKHRRAQELLIQSLAANEHPLRIVNFITFRIRDLLKARLLPEGRRDAQKAATLFGPMHPYRLRLLYEEADRFTVQELRQALRSLLIADVCLKSSVDGRHVMALLVAALTGALDHASFARALQSYVEPWE